MSELKQLIEEYGGIQPPHLAFYMESIRFSSEAAMNSIDYLADFIKMTNETKGQYEMTRELQTIILDHLQNILTHAAALSRYFWPSKPGKNSLHQKRAETLMAEFDLNDGSPLKNRKLRNQLEHFDENLDNYLWSKPLVGYVLPAYVGGVFDNDGVPTHLFRAFYIDVGIFETLGQRYEVQPIVDELCKIHDKFNSANNHT
ncbi:hypothetical protein ACQE3E_15300 [Methylomonas sp. MED-D]|uniref:hypothetical protein n=1 Tax=unclassified Methylomonas TaxID=2608980 RepID=UPI0028A4BFBF|nr:hypothetical protein [Methylomonas sp. MV1]MDT4331213.1 hypothetical protein [Methylomonas sp. MV1]